MRKSLVVSLFTLAPIFAAGCAVDQTSEPQQADDNAVEERGPIGKADLYGQCMEIDIKYCGGKSSGNCYCDDLCTMFGDCCSDYQDECVDDGPTCDPTMMCGQAISCIDGFWYPTTCGPNNCDEPMGPCNDKQCGGFMGLACDEGEFCNYDAQAMCGAADQMGTCESMPEICPEIWSPVCGCDGNNYSSPCDANAAGTSVAQEGDCECQPGYSQQYCWGSMQCVPIGAIC